jgi:hypothetical protein
MHPEPSPVPPIRTRRWRRVLAVGAGVAMVPALYAVASATSGGGSDRPAASVHAAAGTSDPGTELENEHGVVVAKPHGGAPTPSVPEVTTPTPTVPAPTVPTTPEQEVEHPVPEPGDDRGVDPVDDDNSGPGNGPAPTPAPAPAFDQAFSSAGGSITVTVANGAVSLASSSPAPGFAAEVHDNGPSRVEVRFFSSGGQEWRIRVELGSGGLTSEITQHG